MKVLFFSMVFAIVAGTTMAQSGHLIENLQLRNTFDESAKKPAPAQFVFTVPKGKANSWLVDAGLGYAIGKTKTLTSKITAEFHKNNLIEKEQENLSGGLSFEWLQNKNGWQSLITAGGKYIRDWQNLSNAGALTANYSLVNTGSGFRFNAPGYLDNNTFTYTLTPYVGFEHQQIIQTKSGIGRGALLRGIVNLSAAFAVNRKFDPKDVKAPKKFFEISVDYTRRYAAVNNTGNGEGSTFMFKGGANIYLIDDGDTQVSMGLRRNSGSNPLQGLKEQKFWQYSLNVQF